MLCLQLAKNTSPSPISSFLRPLWPMSRGIFTSLEQDMIRTVGKIKDSMKLIDQFHQQLLQETTFQENKPLPVQSTSVTKSIKGDFVLCLGVQDFSPQELTVKVLQKKLLVTGVKKSKSEDGKESFSYKCQIFRKEADLPQDVRAEDLRCTVSADGQLRIEVSRGPHPGGQERTVPIQLTAAPQLRIQSSESGKDSRS